MSAGVDSSVAAVLLKRQGYDVFGITMRLRPERHCPADKNIDDAGRVAGKIGIEHHIFDVCRDFETKVIQNFLSEYLRGRTPNPCVRCNRFIKFGVLMDKARVLGADYLATGHYARVERIRSSAAAGQFPGSYVLRKARDLSKDQSYFLYTLTQNQLKHLLFPLGDYTKPQVRQMAKRFGLLIAGRPESQDICFVSGRHYSEFLNEIEGVKRVGQIVDTKGNVLGSHRGIAFYTLGQRQGLGIACGAPMYVLKIDVRRNRIIVGAKEEVLSKEFLVAFPHFISPLRKKKVVLGVKIRYNYQEAAAEISPFNGKVKVRFEIPQFAAAPGQSAVFYDQDRVIGGGIIDKIN